MERSEILASMGELKLYGMKAAFDEIIATAVKRQHEPQRLRLLERHDGVLFAVDREHRFHQELPPLSSGSGSGRRDRKSVV